MLIHSDDRVAPYHDDRSQGLRNDIIRYYARCLARSGHRITPDHLSLGISAYVADGKARAVREMVLRSHDPLASDPRTPIRARGNDGRIRGRTDVSTRLRAIHSENSSCAPGGVHRCNKATRWRSLGGASLFLHH
jgi:hypothetical protein